MLWLRSSASLSNRNTLRQSPIGARISTRGAQEIRLERHAETAGKTFSWGAEA